MMRTATGAILLALLASPALAQDPPKAEEPPKTEAPPPTPDADADDVDTLRQEYLQLRDELYQSRARAAAVSSALYSTKITIKLAYGTGRFYGVDRATIRLDRASVYDDTSGAIANDDAVRFEGYIAPGRHQISIRVEATGKDDDRFTSATETTFVVQAVEGKDLVVVAKAKDGGDIPYQWKRSEHGTYKLEIDADVKAVANGSDTAKPAPAKKTAAKRHKKGPKKEQKRAAQR